MGCTKSKQKIPVEAPVIETFTPKRTERVLVQIKDEYRKRPPFEEIPSLMITLTILQFQFKESGLNMLQRLSHRTRAYCKQNEEVLNTMLYPRFLLHLSKEAQDFHKSLTEEENYRMLVDGEITIDRGTYRGKLLDG